MAEENEGLTEGAPAGAPEGAPATQEVTDPFDNAEVQQFDRAYVEKLRREAADRRTAAKKYEDVFSAYDDEEQEVWFNLARTLQNDPEAAAEMMEQIAKGIKGVSEIEPTGEKPAGAAETQFLTQEDIEKFYADQKAKENLDKEVAKLNQEMADMGHKPGTSGYNDVLWRAQNQHNGDIVAAQAARVAEFEAAMDEYIQKKAQDALGAPVVTAGGGAPPSGERKIGDFKDSRAALEARLAAIKNQ